jgi:hypothetical protein
MVIGTQAPLLVPSSAGRGGSAPPVPIGSPFTVPSTGVQVVPSVETSK